RSFLATLLAPGFPRRVLAPQFLPTDASYVDPWSEYPVYIDPWTELDVFRALRRRGFRVFEMRYSQYHDLPRITQQTINATRSRFGLSKAFSKEAGNASIQRMRLRVIRRCVARYS